MDDSRKNGLSLYLILQICGQLPSKSRAKRHTSFLLTEPGETASATEHGAGIQADNT